MGKFWRYFAIVFGLCFLLLNLVCYLTYFHPAKSKKPEKPGITKRVSPEIVKMELFDDLEREALVVKTHFSNPMVSGYSVGSVLSPKKVPIVFKPELKGRFTWEDPKTLSYILDSVPSEDYIKAKVKPELCDISGRKLTGNLLFNLGGPRISFVSAQQQGIAANGAPVLILRFNNPVLPNLLNYFLRLSKNGNSIKYTMLGKSTKQELKIVTQGAISGRIKVLLKKGFKGVSLLPSLTQQIHYVDVESKLIVSGIKTGEAGGGNFWIDLNFNGRMKSDVLKQYLDISPPVAFTIDHSYLNNVRIIAPFRPGKAYTLRIRKGLSSLDAIVLEKNFVKHLRFPDLKPDIRLLGEGFYLPSNAQLTIPVETLNVETFKIQIERLYNNNVVNFVREDGFYGYMSDYITKDLPEKKIKVKGPWNEWVETNVDLKDLMGGLSKGTFCVRVLIKKRRWRTGKAVLQVTDLGITAKHSDSNCMVWITSIATSQPVSGVKVMLKSMTNQCVRKGITNKSGLIIFKGPFPSEYKEKPFLVTAELNNDMAFLNLSYTNVCSTQRLPSGRKYLESGYEAFVWSERGVYRPEEDINLYTIIRDKEMKSPEPFPVRFRILKPDGKKWQVFKAKLSDFATNTISFKISRFLPTGNYRAEVLDASDEILGSHSFLVETIRPDRMRVRISISPGHLVAGGTAHVTVSAYQLFGKAASGKTIHGSLQFRSCRFSPANSKHYNFSCSDNREEFSGKTLILGNKILDEKGKVNFEVDLPDHPLPPGRYLAMFSFTVTEEGGRSVTSHMDCIVDPYPVYLGIVSETPSPCINRDAYFGLKALTPQAKPSDLKEVVVHVFKIEWTHGYTKTGGGGWKWMSESVKKKIGCYPVMLKNGKALFKFKPEMVGNYSIKVEAPGTQHVTSISFNVSGSGWSLRSFMNPAEVDLTANKKSFKVGEEAEIKILSPFTGKLLFTVEGQKIYHTEVRDVVRGINMVKLSVKKEYWPNAYVAAQIVRPYWPLKPGFKQNVQPKPGGPELKLQPEKKIDLTKPEQKAKSKPGPGPVLDSVKSAKPVPVSGPDKGNIEKTIKPADKKPAAKGNPSPTPAPGRLAGRESSAEKEKHPYRGFGVLPLVLDKSERSLEINLETPKKVKPGDEITVKLKTTGALKQSVKSEVVLALVDEGLLSLTSEPVPDPLGFFSSLRELECRTSDVFSFLVPCRALVPGGGDSQNGLAKKRLNPVQYEAEHPVVFFYKPRFTDDSGSLEVKLIAPVFAGQLRVVAIATTKECIGSSFKKIFVTPDVVVRITSPRCLAPGDKAVIPLVFFNNRKEEKKLKIKVEASGPIEPVKDLEITVPAEKEAVLRIPVQAKNEFGAADFKFLVTGDGFKLEKENQFPVRPPWGDVTQSESGNLKAGPGNPSSSDLAVKKDKLLKCFPGTEEIRFVLSPSPMAEFIPAARYLIRYPYGCAEQTSSTLLGLAAASKLHIENAKHRTASYIAYGIQRLATMQTGVGGLSMWPYYRYPEPWVSVFAAHILLFIREGNEILLEDVLAELLDYVEGLVTDDENNLDIRAYAGYVCALAKRDVVPQLMRLSEHDISPRAARFIASALKLLKKEALAKEILSRDITGKAYSLYFITPVVEDAMELMTDLQLGNTGKVESAVKRLKKAASRHGRWGTTHECAWALLALNSWSESLGFKQDKIPEVLLSSGDKELFKGQLDKTHEFKLDYNDFKKLVCSVDKSPVFFSWTVSGIPIEKQPVPANKDFKIIKTFYDYEGKEIKDDFILGRPYIVELQFDTLRTLHGVVVSDLLPGGFEIVNSKLSSRRSGTDLKNQNIWANHVDIRDDRFLIFLDIPRSVRSNRGSIKKWSHPIYSYMVRAVSEGEFILPSTQAECMYDPTVQSTTPGGRITVKRSGSKKI